MPVGLGCAFATFILGPSSSVPHVTFQWRTSHTWPCSDEASDLKSAEESLLHKPHMPSPQGCVTVMMEGNFLCLARKSSPFHFF